jgi:hypothetical protein
MLCVYNVYILHAKPGCTYQYPLLFGVYHLCTEVSKMHEKSKYLHVQRLKLNVFY